MSDASRANIIPHLGAITGLIDAALSEGERKISRDQLAYDLFLLRDEAVHDVWVGSPMGLDLDESNKDCALCDLPLREGPASGWYARNSASEWLLGHTFCVTRAVQFGTPPGQMARFGEPGAVVYVLPTEMIR